MKKNGKIIISFLLLLILSFGIAACTVRNDGDLPEEDYNGNTSYTEDYVQQEFSDTDFNALYEQVYRSVVTVKLEYRSSGIFGGQSRSSNTGTGFIVDSENGYIVTSSSIFEISSGNISANSLCSVTFYDGKTSAARLISYDSTTSFPYHIQSSPANSDIALIRLQNTSGGYYTDVQTEAKTEIPAAVTIASSDGLDFGDECFSVATISDEDDDLSGMLDVNIITNPSNRHDSAFYALSEGRKSYFFDNSFDYLIQTGITTNSGCEGAPLFDNRGNVIGMMNLRAEQTSRFTANDPFGISFATPSSTLQQFLTENDIRFQSQETEENASASIIANSNQIEKATDGVAQALMEQSATISSIGSNDYYVADASSAILFKKFENSTANTNIAETSQNFIDRTVKIIVYSDQGLSEGSGMIVDKSGYILTNLHVINKLSSTNEEAGKEANATVDVTGISVYCAFERGTVQDGGREKFVLLPMQVIAYQQREDLAVLKFLNPIYHEDDSGIETINGTTATQGFEQACTFDTSIAKRGGRVIALGNALGYGVASATGIVSVPEFSAYYSDYGYNMIQTDCPINSGNSGGPLFSLEGYIVGINTLGLGGDASTVYGYENVSWAIPAASAVGFLEKINENNPDNDDNLVILNQAKIQYQTLEV